MNGQQHYEEAERLLGGADTMHAEDPARALLIASAQVHATLAVADRSYVRLAHPASGSPVVHYTRHSGR